MRCVIVCGGEIKNYVRIKSFFRNDDYFIFCDRGLLHREKLGVKPDLAVGDFDSCEKPSDVREIIALPKEKDDTDSVFAVKEGIKRGFDEFLIIGALGGRADHSLCNLAMLKMLYGRKKKAFIADDYSTIRVVGQETVKISDDCKYFSVINLFGNAENINIKNAKYPLENGNIPTDWQYGVSNEVEKGRCAEVSAEKGEILLITVDRE